MVKVNIYLMIIVIIKDGGKMIWCMDKDNYILIMAKYNIKDNGLEINLMDGVYYMQGKVIYGKDIKGKLWMVICMEEARYCFVMGPSLMAPFRMAKYVEEDGEYHHKERY